MQYWAVVTTFGALLALFKAFRLTNSIFGISIKIEQSIWLQTILNCGRPVWNFVKLSKVSLNLWELCFGAEFDSSIPNFDLRAPHYGISAHLETDTSVTLEIL